MQVSGAISENNEYLDSLGNPRDIYMPLQSSLAELGETEFRNRSQRASGQVSSDSFTFLLDPMQFRPAPTDWLPRIIPRSEWQTIADGVRQRLKAINHFLVDLYCGNQEVVPPEVIFSCRHFYPDLQGFRPPKDVFVHIYGVDLVKVGQEWTVLEDNLRIPSGITYQIKPRGLLAQFFPDFINGYDIEPYDIRETYWEMFRSVSAQAEPATVLLTDGKHGAAFFEHRFLSELLGIPLVEGADLHRDPDGRIRVQTLDGDIPVDVIYRRVEDLDIFTPGLMQSYLEGKVILINAMGTGAADDKLVYMYAPEIIRHYLGEEPVLKQVPSFNLLASDQRLHVLGNLDELVLKTRSGYGGLGVYVMPDLGTVNRTSITQQIIERPEAFIAQETLDFSKHMVLDVASGQLVERFIDLRVFAFQNESGNVTVPPGGLTRVSSGGTRITNNSSGGMCKPTWVVR